MGFPFEIITMLASTVLGGLMSVWAESRKAKAEQQKMIRDYTIMGIACLIGFSALGWMIWLISKSVS